MKNLGKSERGQLGTGYEECTSALAVEYFDQRQQDAVTRVGSGLNYSVALTSTLFVAVVFKS